MQVLQRVFVKAKPGGASGATPSDALKDITGPFAGIR